MSIWEFVDEMHNNELEPDETPIKMAYMIAATFNGLKIMWHDPANWSVSGKPWSVRKPGADYLAYGATLKEALEAAAK